MSDGRDRPPETPDPRPESSDTPPATEDHLPGTRLTSRLPAVVAVGLTGVYATLGLAVLGSGRGSTILGGATALCLIVGLGGWLYRGTAGPRGPGLSPTIARATTLAFLLVEAVTFGTGFAYFAAVASAPSSAFAPTHPVVKATVTALLVASSLTLWAATDAHDRGDRESLVRTLRLTLALGTLFLVGQAGEYYSLLQRGYTPASGALATAFYGLTGLHGLHVLGGLVALCVVLARTVARGGTSSRRVDLLAVALYWHFVDAVWLLLVAAFSLGPRVASG